MELLTKQLFTNFCQHINSLTFSHPVEAYKLIKDYFERFGYEVQYHSEVYDDGDDDEGILQYDYLYVWPKNHSSAVFVYHVSIGQEGNLTKFLLRPYMGKESF